jgi:hypothetical protein
MVLFLHSDHTMFTQDISISAIGSILSPSMTWSSTERAESSTIEVLANIFTDHNSPEWEEPTCIEVMREHGMIGNSSFRQWYGHQSGGTHAHCQIRGCEMADPWTRKSKNKLIIFHFRYNTGSLPLSQSITVWPNVVRRFFHHDQLLTGFFVLFIGLLGSSFLHQSLLGFLYFGGFTALIGYAITQYGLMRNYIPQGSEEFERYLNLWSEDHTMGTLLLDDEWKHVFAEFARGFDTPPRMIIRWDDCYIFHLVRRKDLSVVSVHEWLDISERYQKCHGDIQRILTFGVWLGRLYRDAGSRMCMGYATPSQDLVLSLWYQWVCVTRG